MPLAVPEHRVLELWQSVISSRTDLLTQDKEPVKIIYSGRPGNGRGPDLQDAVIATRYGLFQGDIEIHVNSSDWYAHGHHQDKNYNPVILHVVYRHDAGKDTVLQNGLEVPTLALDGYAETQANHTLTSAFTPVISTVCGTDTEFTAGILDKAGDIRFSSKKNAFEQELSRTGPGEVLYQGIMTALGYTKNKNPMAELARHVPLKELEGVLAEERPDDDCLEHLQALLLGAAGLLPFQRPAKQEIASPYLEKLAYLWAKSGKTALMSFSNWEHLKVRPGNYPARRIAALGYLLARFRKKGLLDSLKQIIEETGSDGRILEESLLVNADGFWRQYTDFGLPLKRPAPALLGNDRAAVIIVNILLPFYAGYAGYVKQLELEEKTLGIYRHYRATAENSVERHMRKQLGLKPGDVAAARRRQGVLHLYKTYCTQGKCTVCPLYNVIDK